MVIQLSKGQKVDLTKDTSLKSVIVGLGWSEPKYDSRYDFDLDASAFLLNTRGKCRNEQDFIFYNNLKAPGIEHTGDERTGGSTGDDEQLIINFDEIPADIDKIAITVTIHEAAARNQNFGQVDHAFVRIEDKETGEEIVRFDLGEDFAIETALVFAELYRHNGEWKFNAVGAGYNGGLASLVRDYGLDV